MCAKPPSRPPSRRLLALTGGVNPGARYATAGLVPRDYRLFPVIPDLGYSGIPRFGNLRYGIPCAGLGSEAGAGRRASPIGDPPPGNIGDRDYSPRGYIG